ncbi:MAG TPA: aminotransferase class I/II-fold pyridoxal phosphate-dependent enzyme, partial [Gaiellaceae bacterium]|nr:aminotransferase class I/II-fold pyridoxal phosphate-dependent enzyme [Gaiellaceae bacterium]
IARVQASDTGYVGTPAPLGAAFSGFAERAWGWQVDPARVRATTDVSVAIVETLRRVIGPGDGVIITPPVYPPFFDLVPEAGGTVVEVPLIDDGAAHRLDLDGIEAAFQAGARTLLLCNPHNPLGLVHSRASLESLAELADRFGATVVSDEIHAPLVHSGIPFHPFLSVSDAARERGVCVTSASKGWNLAGTKCAIMVAASERGVALLDSMPYEVGFRTSLLGLHASVAAFERGGPWLDAAIGAIESSADLMERLLADHLPGVLFRRPSASYLGWLDFRPLGWGDDPSIRALESGRVALNAGPTFGRQGAGFARINLACSPEVLTEAVHRLAAA